MNVLSFVMMCFSIVGAIDCILNNRFGIGKEWERGFQLLGVMALTMIGMLVLAPTIAHYLTPLLTTEGKSLFEPSIIPSSILANDMGAATLSQSLAQSEKMGYFNGLVVSSMMGCTISYTLPLALGVVEKRQHKLVLYGLMCGIITIPTGCIVAGLMIGLSFKDIVLDLLPLVVLAIVLSIGLLKKPNVCMKVFRALGVFIRIVIIFGLVVGIISYTTGKQILPYAATTEEGAQIIFNAAMVLSGAFPLMYIIGRMLRKPLQKIGQKCGMNYASALGLVGSLASATTTYAAMKDMDDRGAMVNSAFTVSGAFVLASHLAFTLAINDDYLSSVIVGKLVSGICAAVLAWMLDPVLNKKTET